jgi:hypothetical protein
MKTTNVMKQLRMGSQGQQVSPRDNRTYEHRFATHLRKLTLLRDNRDSIELRGKENLDQSRKAKGYE